MTDRMERVFQKAEQQIGELLEERREEIFESYRKAYQAHEKETPFSFLLGVAIKITEDGPGDKVKTTLRWTEKHQADAEATVSAQGDMLDEQPGLRFNATAEASAALESGKATA